MPSLNALSSALISSLGDAFLDSDLDLSAFDFSAMAANDGSFSVEVPAPNPHCHPLTLSTENGEITVGFDSYHTHLGMFGEQSEADTIQEALALIGRILGEESIAYSLWCGEQCKGSWLDAPDAPVRFQDHFFRQAPGDILQVRSWRGTFDREVPVLQEYTGG